MKQTSGTYLAFLIYHVFISIPLLSGAPNAAAAEKTAGQPAISSAAADKDALYRIVPDTGIYLGWMPVAYVNAGEKWTIDLSRYMDVDALTGIAPADKPGDSAAPINLNGRFLEIAISEDRLGLIDMAVNIHTANTSKKIYLTLVVNRKTSRRFTYTPDKPVKKAAVAGTFNGWSDAANPMKDDDRDGVWEAVVSLDPGSHMYKFVVDGEWISDPGNQSRSNDQYRNSLLTIEGDGTKSRPHLIAKRQTQKGIVLQVVTAEYNTPLSKISAIIQEPDGSNRKAEFKIEKDFLNVNVEGAGAGSFLRVVVMDDKSEVSSPLRIPLGPQSIFRWNDAVIYFAMLDRFSNGDPKNDAPTKDSNILYSGEYHGGDLSGLADKIEDGYFTRLGVNAIWLSPVYQNPDKAFQEYIVPYRYFSGYHGYWPTDFYKIDHRLGDMALLKKVVAAAHRKGIRILLDMVFNHTHIAHPYWNEHPEWYIPLKLPDGRENLRLWDEYSFTTWFDRFLPTFDMNQPALIKALLENAKWWLDETDADGFRLDAVKHVQHQFWCNLRKYLRQTVEQKRNERLYMVGETFLSRQGIMEFVGPNKLDGQFDFPLYDAIIPAFAKDGNGFQNLDAALESSERIYGKETIASPLVGNQDKPRFMAFADGDLPDDTIRDDREVGYAKPPKVDHASSYARLKNALTFIFTIDGAPLLYYGDEYGLTGAGDPDNRRDMRFADELAGQEKEMLAYSGRLGHIRAGHPALRYGNRRTVLLEADLYAYTRAYFGDCALVIFNKSSQAQKVRVLVSPDIPPGRYINLLKNQEAEVDAAGILETIVPPMTSMIFVKL